MKFRQCIEETHTWCAWHLKGSNLKGDLRDILRSKSLRPKKDFHHYLLTDHDRIKLISNLSDRRTREIHKKKITSDQPLSGRILCYYPELSLQDAVVDVASKGYIAENDSPPWDTWLHYSPDDIEMYHEDLKSPCLFAWVPGQLVNLIDKALLEDTYGCLVWAINLEQKLEVGPGKTFPLETSTQSN